MRGRDGGICIRDSNLADYTDAGWISPANRWGGLSFRKKKIAFIHEEPLSASAQIEIREVTDADIAAVNSFLESHLETSLLLLNNLRTYGPRLTKAVYSGNFRAIEEDGRMVGVFTMTRGGTMLAQTGGRTDFSPQSLDISRTDNIPIRGVIGEWQCAASIWEFLRSETGWTPTLESREVLYRLPLAKAMAPRVADEVRRLAAGDFDQWYRLNDKYLVEVGVPGSGTTEQRRNHFVAQAAAGHWWGKFDSGRVVSIAGLNAVYGSVGQVGGVYTRPRSRQQGHGRDVMDFLATDCANRHGIDRLILFTPETNAAARRLYESMGFSPAGQFGLFFREAD